MECFVVKANGYRFERSGESLIVCDARQFAQGQALEKEMTPDELLDETQRARAARYGVIERFNFLLPGDDPARTEEFFFLAIADWLAKHGVELAVAS